MSILLNNLINDIASHFIRSSKAKSRLNELQETLYDAQKSLKRYQKIRWLSKWQSITTYYDTLQSVLTYFCDIENDDVGTSDGLIFTRLRTFKHIYYLYCLADILYGLLVLSKTFQYKHVDVSTVGALVKTEITSICMLFIIESTDLNASTFNEKTYYHIISDFGPHGGYLKRLSSKIRGAKYHDILMIRDRTRTD